MTDKNKEILDKMVQELLATDPINENEKGVKIFNDMVSFADKVKKEERLTFREAHNVWHEPCKKYLIVLFVEADRISKIQANK